MGPYSLLVGFKSIRVAIFYAGLPKPNATLLLYVGGSDFLYSSNPRRVGIYKTYTWASRWASIYMGSIYSNTLPGLGTGYAETTQERESLLVSIGGVHILWTK